MNTKESREFFEALEFISNEKGINSEILAEKLKSAALTARISLRLYVSRSAIIFPAIRTSASMACLTKTVPETKRNRKNRFIRNEKEGFFCAAPVGEL